MASAPLHAGRIILHAARDRLERGEKDIGDMGHGHSERDAHVGVPGAQRGPIQPTPEQAGPDVQ